MIGELQLGFQTRTVTWNFFTKLTETIAECNYCHAHYNYRTTRSHLLKHVRKKHPDAILQFKKGKILPPVPRSDEISRTSSPGVEERKEADESQNGAKGSDEETSSDVWSLFTRIGSAIAKCNLCKVELSCEYSITDLTKHWKTEHLGVLLKRDPSEYAPTGNGSGNVPAQENCSSTLQISQVSSLNDEPAARKVEIKLRRSPAWKYFTKLDKTYAACKICEARFSYLSISNLMRHVVRKHPCRLLAGARSGEQRDTEEDDDLSLEAQDQFAISDDEEGSDGESSEEVDRIGEKASDARGSVQSSELRRSKRARKENPWVKMESEDVSVNGNLQDQEDNITGKDKGIRPRAYLWQVFTKLKNGYSQCKICGATMSRKSNAGNLWRHIRGAHPSFVSVLKKKLAESQAAVGKCPSAESGRSSPGERAATSDEEGAKLPTGGDASDSPPSEPEERNRASEVGQTESGGAKPNGRKRRGRSKPRAEERKETSEVGRTDSGGGARAGEEPGCLLSERFAKALEEGNRLMRGVREVVERQGRALDRIAACLEGMSRLTESDA